MLREARLRPEYAHLYPMLEPGIWAPAAMIAEKVAATRLLQLAETYVLHDRVLVDAHFEFRGGSVRSQAARASSDLSTAGQPATPASHSRYSVSSLPRPGASGLRSAGTVRESFPETR
jgi:hypothetical protein